MLCHFRHFRDVQPLRKLFRGGAVHELSEGFIVIHAIGFIRIDNLSNGFMYIIRGNFFQGNFGKARISAQSATENNLIGFRAALAPEVAYHAHQADVGNLIL